MGELINLNKARKARDKATAKRNAETNRAAHGRSKADRQAADTARDRDAARLDGHKRDDDTPGD
ncbi:MAG: DUF4169 family protein [Brevundimonas sp.]|uniref:DUF4169 family protein n=1 Tax=Brevundimonas sp. TaxID=1871086 RepID=UPI0012299C5B|nr:DUF4169 family protein [Brevundimonas sp.]RZJ16310.1 MAG: DUF4169 family protein [Brevundimonas sp.]